jgi:4-amino-4-deoxy-L-arabinose transferase-like glycosyltransferase
VTGLLYFVALLGLLVSGLTLLRGVSAGLIGGMVLLSMAPLLQWATAQYADVPLAYEFLAALLLLFLDVRTNRREPWALVWAGFFAGAAAWTKQEGAVFLAAVPIATFIAERFARWRWLLAGAAPGMLLSLWFKFSIAPPGDIASPVAEMILKIKDPARYAQIGSSFVHRLAVMGWAPGHPLILLAILALVLRRDGSRRYAGPVWVSGSVLASMLMSYCVVFLITPHDLTFHLNAWDRLLLQLWPGVVLLFCRLLPEDAVKVAP